MFCITCEMVITSLEPVTTVCRVLMELGYYHLLNLWKLFGKLGNILPCWKLGKILSSWVTRSYLPWAWHRPNAALAFRLYCPTFWGSHCCICMSTIECAYWDRMSSFSQCCRSMLMLFTTFLLYGGDYAQSCKVAPRVVWWFNVDASNWIGPASPAVTQQ